VGTLHGLLETLDADPLRRGKQFESICKWFLANDPIYRRELRRVWLWDEWPEHKGQDIGIDLVAEDARGRLWAIQAKAYDPSYSVTKRDVDSFLSESARPEISFRLLIATTNRIGHNASRTIHGQEKPASKLMLADLERAQVEWPTSIHDLRPQAPQPKTPRSHQSEAIHAVVNGFDVHDRGQLIMACGTGKTLTSLFITAALHAQRVLVLVPSLSLLAQSLREWTANDPDFVYLPVCSDVSVSDSDAAISWTSDLGFPVTTDPGEIAAFLRLQGSRQVVFATYQSSPRIADAYKESSVPAFDIIIADEAHRCAGPASSDFATVLDEDAILASRRLFMTATPRYFTGRVVRLAKEADFEVASMDDATRFGPVFHRLSFGEAIKRDLLSDYQVAVIGVDDATYYDWATNGRFVTLDGKDVTDARTLAGQIGLAKSIRKYHLRRMISFHSRIRRARDFASSLPEIVAWMPPEQRPVGKPWSTYVSGEMSAQDRRLRLNQLRSLDDEDWGLLANAQCLSEGVDVPTLDGVAFIDPRRSEVDIIQAVGRAIRKAPDKQVGTIVVPVFVGSQDDPEAVLDDSAFKPVWDVIKALRAHDAELAIQLDELRRSLGKGSTKVTLPKKIHLDLPVAITGDFANAFEVRLVERTSSSWEFWFGALQQFIERHGNALPNRTSTGLETYPLGQWVNHQRTAYANGTLSSDKADRLDALTGWAWDAHSHRWEEGYKHLEAFTQEFHNPRPGHRYVAPDGYRLGQWVMVQRVEYVRGRQTPDRIARLESIDGWTWDAVEYAWNEGYEHLQTFVGGFGHARPSRTYIAPDGFRLGQWVNSYARPLHKKGRISAERVAQLDDLPGWAWDAFAVKWEEAFARLTAFIAREGHSSVPHSYKEDGFNLGSWVNTQRSKHSKGKLDPEQAKRLDALQGWTW